LVDGSNGGFFGSQIADDVYYAATTVDRKMLEPPLVDRVVYAGANGEMARAFVRARPSFWETRHYSRVR